MSLENTGISTKQNVEAPPTTVVTKVRNLSDYPSFTSSAECDDPPGVPVMIASRSIGRTSHTSRCDSSAEPSSVQLVDENENIMFDDCESFADQLMCPMDQPVKVVAIVGNTGDGKSYTMNQSFFNGKKVFATSPTQTTCTMGVWAAYLPSKRCILLDTEGMLGTAVNQNQHRRLLLKVFAVSDLVIYLTKAPRLHTDMFTFLADASDSFAKHFRPDLEALAKRTGLPWSPTQLGPAVIVFQETRHTDPLSGSSENNDFYPATIHVNSKNDNPRQTSDSVTNALQKRLADMKRNVESFSSLHYLGTQTKEGTTDFKPLNQLTMQLLDDNSIRTPRKLEHIFCSLHLLNSRFASDIPATDQYTFVEEYFTCPARCDNCSTRCCLSVGHLLSKQEHQATLSSANSTGQHQHERGGCQYNPNLKNKLYYCKDCYALGIKNIVVPKAGDSVLDAARYFYSGYVLECKRHGIIYQSRNLWSANPEPEQTARVLWEVVHVWSGEKTVLQGIHPFSQILLDSFSTVSKQVSGLAGPPVRLLGDLFTDSLAPDYWQRNTTIRSCALCKFEFPDPSVDGIDYNNLQRRSPPLVEPAGEHRSSQQDIPDTARRKSGKLARGTVLLPRTSSLTPPSTEESQLENAPRQKALSIPNDATVDLLKHHCRACGRGICGACSTGRLPVAGFGPCPVRVCDEGY
ncbi:unnamed protein product [Dicrocoelium dendriticum]|nr:unnamed protein product [Dicrocoelium dendriticum]